MRGWSFALALLLLGAGSAGAQTKRELDLDFRPWAAGTLAFLWSYGEGDARAVGISAGGGIDALDRTLVPDTDSPRFDTFYQLLHVGALHRWRPGDRWDLDVGVRLGFGDVRECTASDCWPGTYLGLYVAPMWGGRHFKIGPRIMTAASRYVDHTDFVVYTEILNGRVALRW